MLLVTSLHLNPKREGPSACMIAMHMPAPHQETHKKTFLIEITVKYLLIPLLLKIVTFESH